MTISKLREKYHKKICNEIIRISKKNKVEYPNFADGDNKSSIAIAWGIVKRLQCSRNRTKQHGQTTGDLFEALTREFLQESFSLLSHLRPGKWSYSVKSTISAFYQYEHLAYLDSVLSKDKTLSSALGGDYIIKPDIVVGRLPVSDSEINKNESIITGKDIAAKLTPLREKNHSDRIVEVLHASISCKWTIRSDRAQNTRTEALNLIRNRKGHLPHVSAVTAEPLPTRLAALALGTGDLDCVYHFALPELKASIEDTGNHDQLDMLLLMIEGRRLRDISDLPFDLAL